MMKKIEISCPDVALILPDDAVRNTVFCIKHISATIFIMPLHAFHFNGLNLKEELVDIKYLFSVENRI